jgi:pilus assembly protein CpaC
MSAPIVFSKRPTPSRNPRTEGFRKQFVPRATALLASGFWLLASSLSAETYRVPDADAAGAGDAKELLLTVGKSLVVDSPVNIQRVSVANGDLAEVIAIAPKEVLINGKAPGETTLLIWQQGGTRLFYDLTVRQNSGRIDAVRQELAHELNGQDVTINFQNDTAFLSGTVKDLTSAERAAAIAATLGKVVNLLHVTVPPVEAQILLKVRFADVDRNASLDLGVNIFSTGATNTVGEITTGAIRSGMVNEGGLTLSDALNVLLIRKDLNLAATIKALQAKSLLEILAEPNVMAINGKQASFVAGGEFPFPTLQGGGSGLGAVTISFREFGIRLQFLPTVTPRGTIRLQVMPEVSSLDFAHGLTFQGFNIPALATRRIQTEIELESGQSFAIAGLLDNRLTETLAKVPGLANLPLLGKLFTTKSWQRQNSELLVLVTPELVRPIPGDQPLPNVHFAKPVKMNGTAEDVPQTSRLSVTGPVPVNPENETVPVEQLMELRKAGQAPAAPVAPNVQFVPVPAAPAQDQPANPGLSQTPMPAKK